MQILQFFLALSLMVIIHEFGHYITARMFGVRVEKFYLFFNPFFTLFKYKSKKSETEYGIGWLPLGGYVKLSGMVDESFDTKYLKSEPKPYEFRSKPAWQRFIIMSAGVVSLAFWICAYAVVGLAYVLVAFVHETLLLFCTVTFGSILAKKHKILTSVAVYYGIQLLIQTVWLVVEGVLSLGISAISVVPEVLVPETQVLWLVLGILLFYVCALALIASFFYKFAVSRLRGNLNLA